MNVDLSSSNAISAAAPDVDVVARARKETETARGVWEAEHHPHVAAVRGKAVEIARKAAEPLDKRVQELKGRPTFTGPEEEGKRELLWGLYKARKQAVATALGSELGPVVDEGEKWFARLGSDQPLNPAALLAITPGLQALQMSGPAETITLTRRFNADAAVSEEGRQRLALMLPHLHALSKGSDFWTETGNGPMATADYWEFVGEIQRASALTLDWKQVAAEHGRKIVQNLRALLPALASAFGEPSLEDSVQWRVGQFEELGGPKRPT